MRWIQVDLQSLMMGIVAIAIVVGVKPWQSFYPVQKALMQAQQERSERGQSQTAQLVTDAVYDGDILKVTSRGTETRIRLCGIDAPEKAQPLGIAARDHLRSLLNQGDGSVIVVPVEKDRYGRTVAELFIQRRSGQGNQPRQEIAINAQMVADGYAYRYGSYSDRCPNGRLLASLEADAQAARRGVWSNPDTVRPWDYRYQRQ
jgi:endonuclease YncB( thermonuclease family)